ncbi:phosphonate metabolism protein PhnM [Clostridioides difficile]|nr:amidohydrolase [Clostridioides difficile]UWD41059.1 amidohydrolase [Clostridioides difficile]UWD44841.1 amidohydrolase [Clostridioides difficile]VFF93330.1 phosphonate metabolism protein PhnM [Clostridioides difficile]VIF83995.1 phosphonate metabolism protein PhnM [Clostridioides difficile]
MGYGIVAEKTNNLNKAVSLFTSSTIKVGICDERSSVKENKKQI